MTASFLSGDHPASQSLFEARFFLATGDGVPLARGFFAVGRDFLVGDGEPGSEGAYSLSRPSDFGVIRRDGGGLADSELDRFIALLTLRSGEKERGSEVYGGQ